MLKSFEIINLLKARNLNFISGVPCSIFKDFLIELNNDSDFQHLSATSEGEACGLATGYYLATAKLPIVYMQNSGLGNSVNPLTSLMDEKVYSIPAILFISWRGEPGMADEPQHVKMGEITIKLLETLGIEYQIADENVEKFEIQLDELTKLAFEKSRAVALVFRKGIIEKNDKPKSQPQFTREQALEILLIKIGKAPIISTTGKTSREIFELREKYGQDHDSDFLTVGSMGCSASIGFSIAKNTDKPVFVIDGDGAVLMKMGTLATIGNYSAENFIHIVVDNSSYDSTGGQSTVSKILDWQKLFQAVGYKQCVIAQTSEQLENLDITALKKPAAVIVKVDKGSRADLGRPTTTPNENKQNFMKFIQSQLI